MRKILFLFSLDLLRWLHNTWKKITSQKILQLQGKSAKQCYFLTCREQNKNINDDRTPHGLSVWSELSFSFSFCGFLYFLIASAICFSNTFISNLLATSVVALKNSNAAHLLFIEQMMLFYLAPVNQWPHRKHSAPNTSQYCFMDNSEAQCGLFTLLIFWKPVQQNHNTRQTSINTKSFDIFLVSSSFLLSCSSQAVKKLFLKVYS